MDLSIGDLKFDSSCQLSVTIKNQSHDLPKIFYSKHNSSRLKVVKGEQTEMTPSLHLLDVERKLQKKGGSLRIAIAKPFHDNPDSFEISLSDFDELRDFNPRDNQRFLSGDCRFGLGVIDGDPVMFDQPDLAVFVDHHQLEHCVLKLDMTNLMTVPLPENFFDVKAGAVIKVVDLELHEHKLTVPVIEADPNQQLRVSNHAQWRWNLRGIGTKKIRVGVWYVEGDRDFSNNQIELNIPEYCI